jgi:hypothetical protein
MDSEGPVVSVRGHARRSVHPDSASVFGSFELVAQSKPAGRFTTTPVTLPPD